jgi:aryl-alcohol dehydrogenase-like predicted oxidoreductase
VSGAPLPTRQLGLDGPSVSAIGLGCMGMSEFYGAVDEAAAVQTVRRAVELGVTLFDTADMYGMGENERLLARALGPDRERVVVATKFGQIRDETGAFVGLDGSPEHVRRACDASLRRLGTDCIDLYQLHRVDPATPIEETVGAMQQLVLEGKVRHLGLSEVTADELRRAAATAPIATVQSEYSLLERSVEREVLPECVRLGVGFLAFSPLMRGLIARRFTSTDDLDSSDSRRAGRYPRLHGDALEANQRLAQVVWELADARGVPPAQIALAWLVAQDVVPIPGAKRVEHLEQNVGASAVALDADEHARLDAAVGAGGAAHGQRLPSRPAPPTGPRTA